MTRRANSTESLLLGRCAALVLRRARMESGLTQAQVSAMTGRDRPNIARLESSVRARVPTLPIVMEYCAAVGLPFPVFAALLVAALQAAKGVRDSVDGDDLWLEPQPDHAE